MSMHWSDEESLYSHSDTEALNPEDIDMDEMPETKPAEGVVPNYDHAETGGSDLDDSEENVSDHENYVAEWPFNPEFIKVVEKTFEIQRYAEEDRGVPASP